MTVRDTTGRCLRTRLLILWSAPRCRSTAFERMMTERGDVTVVHEPFSQLADFGGSTVCGDEVRSTSALIARLLALARTATVFVKDTTDFHYPDAIADRHFLRAATHTFLIRDPAAAITSHHRLNPDLGRDEIGFRWLYEIFLAVADATGSAPAVLDADDLIADPAGLVAGYCARVGIPFLADALTWRPGMLAQWQRTARWHVAASESSGFGPRRPAARPLIQDERLRSYLDYHQPCYEAMYAQRLRV